MATDGFCQLCKATCVRDTKTPLEKTKSLQFVHPLWILQVVKRIQGVPLVPNVLVWIHWWNGVTKTNQCHDSFPDGVSLLLAQCTERTGRPIGFECWKCAIFVCENETDTHT